MVIRQISINMGKFMIFTMVLSFVLPIVLLVIPAEGRAGLPAADLPFCRKPYQMTCPGGNAHKIREQKIARIEKELKLRAFQSMLDELEQDRELQDGILRSSLRKFEDIDNIKPKRIRLGVEKLFYANLRKEFSQYITENNLPMDLGDEIVTEALHIAIEEASDISPVIKERMHSILNETRIVAFQNNVEDNTLEDLHVLYKLCTKSFEDNAFATTIRKNKVVVICPGEMIGSIEFGNDFAASSKLKLMPLMVTLGHELSHHFDFRHYPSAYKQILEEMYGYRDHFKKPVEKYMAEITADSWGLKVAAIVMKKIGDPMTRSQMYAGGLNDLCGSQDDGFHPSGEFRIEILARKYLCSEISLR